MPTVFNFQITMCENLSHLFKFFYTIISNRSGMIICYPAHSHSGITKETYTDILFHFNENNHHDSWISGRLHNMH